MKYKEKQTTLFFSKEMPKSEKPREKIAERGVETLKDQELLMVLLGTGTTERRVDIVAKDLLGVLDAAGDGVIPYEEIAKVKGIGAAKASLVTAALELGRRRSPRLGRIVQTPEDVFRLISHYGSRDRENFLVVMLNGAHEITGVENVSVGLVNRTLVHPREVFTKAVEKKAAAIIVAHNHPSGYVEPSDEDVEVTMRLVSAAAVMGIPLLDHLVFSATEYFSMSESGILK